jgi:hypothetical protein
VDGRAADLVSPVEGQVLSVNPELASRPSLTTTDPYGRGWLATIRVPRLAADLRNLLFGGLSRRFMEEARSELDHRLMAFSGSVLQDGGEALADFGERLSEPEWRRLVNDFLLT